MKEEKILIQGLKINYKTIGEGKPILVLHGWRSSSDKWVETAKLLKGYQVIIPDLPGFGKSSRPQYPWNLEDYAEFANWFVKSLNLRDFVLAGHSFGGATAVRYSLIYPKGLKQMFLVAPSCIRERTAKKTFFFILSKFFKIFSFFPFFNLFRRAFYKIFLKSDYQHSEGIMKKTYLNIIKEDLTNSLNSVKIPTIVIWGDKDDTLPVRQGYQIQKRIEGSKLEIVKGADHSLEYKMPEELSQAMLKHL